MSINKRVIWSEGMFLRPQHFQQHDRYLERYTELRSGALRPNAWGFTQLELEQPQLAFGKLALRRAQGVFPDGTPFSMPDDDPLPPVIDISPSVRDKTVFLALPVRKAGALDYTNGANGSFARFSRGEVESRDAAGDTAAAATIQVGELATSLRLEGESLADFACIPLAHVIECRATDRTVTLDSGFMPTVLRLEPAKALTDFLKELRGLLHQRGEELALRATGTARGGAAEISDFLLLGICNRYEPVVTHWANSLDAHPEDFYAFAVALAGELATFSDERTRRPRSFTPYEHMQLRASFDPVIAALRDCFSRETTRTVEQIVLTAVPEIGMWRGIIADKTLLEGAEFVLAVRADLPADQIRRYFPTQSKVAAVEHIRRYVMEMIAGVPLNALPQVPRQIPFHAGYVYFGLDNRSAPWKQLRSSGAIAIHVAGQFPGIALELWAIRG
jgi:type VI secretion system protein ImpJ